MPASNQYLNRGEKIIFNNDYSADTYLTESAANILQRYLSSTKIDEVQLYGTSGSSNRAAVFRLYNQDLFAVPLDLTGAAIQTAVDNLPSGGIVRIPANTFNVTTTITLASNITIQGDGPSNDVDPAGTVLKGPSGGLGAPFFQSKNTSAAYTKIFIRNVVIDNRSKTYASGIGIDFTRISNGGVENVRITDVEMGIYLKGAAHNNIFITVHLSSVDTGVRFTAVASPDNTGPSSNTFFSVEVNNAAVGYDIIGRNNRFISCSVEVFTNVGFYISPSAYSSQNILISPRVENTPPTTGTAISIGSSSLDTQILAPYLSHVVTYIQDSSTLKRNVFLASCPQKLINDPLPRLNLGEVLLFNVINTSKVIVNNSSDTANAGFHSAYMTVASSDVEFGTNGKGVSVLTPDNTKRYRIFVNNSGNPDTHIL